MSDVWLKGERKRERESKAYQQPPHIKSCPRAVTTISLLIIALRDGITASAAFPPAFKRSMPIWLQSLFSEATAPRRLLVCWVGELPSHACTGSLAKLGVMIKLHISTTRICCLQAAFMALDGIENGCTAQSLGVVLRRTPGSYSDKEKLQYNLAVQLLYLLCIHQETTLQPQMMYSFIIVVSKEYGLSLCLQPCRLAMSWPCLVHYFSLLTILPNPPQDFLNVLPNPLPILQTLELLPMRLQFVV